MVKINKLNPRVAINPDPLYPWKVITPPVVVNKAPVEAANGHGLGSTKWNGCF